MLKLSYKLQRGGPLYAPNYPQSGYYDENIFIVKGNNDLGKSTMMQIIALGLYGLHSDDISENIKSKMKRLLSDDTQIFDFEFKISNLNKNININSSLQGANINNLKVSVNDKHSTPTGFSDNFKLIFDIPDEVTKKLSTSLYSIKSVINDYYTMVTSYRGQLNSSIRNKMEYEKKEKRLNEIREKRDERSKQIDNSRERIDKIESEYKNLKKIYVVKNYTDLLEKLEILNSKKKIYERKNSTIVSKQRRTRFSNASQNFETQLVKCKSIFQNLGSANKDSRFQDISRSLSLLDMYFNREEYSKTDLDKLLKHTSEICTILNKNPLSETDPESQELELLDKVIDVFRNYVKLNPKIPGTNGKSLIQFLSGIEDRRKELDNKLIKKRAFEKIKRLANDLAESVIELEKLRKKIPSYDEDENSVEEKYNEQKIKEIEDEEDKTSKELDKIQPEYEKLSETDKNMVYNFFDEDRYKSLDTEFNKLNELIKELRVELETDNKLILELENTRSEPITQSVEKLQKQMNIINNLLTKMDSWKNFLKNLDGLTILEKNKLDENAKEFYNILGITLAKILGKVYFENKEWNLSKIDIINESFIVQNRERPILFTDIGTGHNALNSLMAKIKQDYNGKKKILLLDEIGIMDSNNINRLIEEIKTQIERNEVVLAILNLAERDLDHIVISPIPIFNGEK